MHTPTPTPWKQATLLVLDADGYQVSHCTRWDRNIPKPYEAEANAARIVACVNAFHGSDIPTEKISEGCIQRVREGLNEIAMCCRALRAGGPAPEDLQELSDALEEATDKAAGLLLTELARND